MNIAFDAKRYFHNNTGLGNYSRTLADGLAILYPEHQYYLCNPKASQSISMPAIANMYEVQPADFWHKQLPAVWRSKWVLHDLRRLQINLYHGLSHEIPIGLPAVDIPSVVTMHDLIFERHPEQYKKSDVFIYRKKFKHACAHADRIIAISEATKADLVELYNVAPHQIDVCYQSCHAAFSKPVAAADKEELRRKLVLPERFFLYVGSIIERKNLLNICQALAQLKGPAALPLVVIGSGKKYKEKVRGWLAEKGLSRQVIFLKDSAAFGTGMQTPENMAAIYQLSAALIYPSFYEGFGIPILEALASGTPVITSNVSCMPETAGAAAVYVSPASPEEIAAAMTRIATDPELCTNLVQRGLVQAQEFNLDRCTAAVMNVYKKIVK